MMYMKLHRGLILRRIRRPAEGAAQADECGRAVGGVPVFCGLLDAADDEGAARQPGPCLAGQRDAGVLPDARAFCGAVRI